MAENIRNIAIIAHVDHGKTTLVDAMLRQSGVFRENQMITERVMDTNDLEKERGITILSKNLSIQVDGVKINIVDTPGHADFGGEVERVLKMVDSVLLLVDAFDGPMPQTRFVLKKSLDLGIRPIVVINKIDRPGARPEWAVDQVFDLFCELNADENQLDFPVVYTSAKQGYAKRTLEEPATGMQPLFAMIREHVAPPVVDPDGPFQMLVASIAYNDYIGRIATGKIFTGKVRTGETVALVQRDGTIHKGRISKLLGYEGLKQLEVEEAIAGDIVTIAGFRRSRHRRDLGRRRQPGGDPLRLHRRADPGHELHGQLLPLRRPRGEAGHLAQHPRAPDHGNCAPTSPCASRTPTTPTPSRSRAAANCTCRSSSRTCAAKATNWRSPSRRSSPARSTGSNASRWSTWSSTSPRSTRGGHREARPAPGRNGLAAPDGRRQPPRVHHPGPRPDRLPHRVPDRHPRHRDHDPHLPRLRPWKGPIPGRKNGVLIAMEAGVTVAYGLFGLQERGILFVGPGVEVYEGMIVGEHAKENDLVVNVGKGKKLTNIRASGSDEAVRLTPPRQF